MSPKSGPTVEDAERRVRSAEANYNRLVAQRASSFNIKQAMFAVANALAVLEAAKARQPGRH